MKNNRLTRREVLSKLAQLSAGLAGVGATKAGLISAQTRVSKAELEATVRIGALSTKAKMIKALLFPRDEIFLSEFGGLPTGFIPDPGGGEKCGLFIELRSGTTLSIPLKSCDKNGCGQQDCRGLKSCPINSCGEQSRGVVMEPSLFSPEALEDVMSDPFIKALCKALKVTRVQDLGNELRRLLLNM